MSTGPASRFAWRTIRARGRDASGARSPLVNVQKPQLRETIKQALLATPEHARAEWSRAIGRTLAGSELLTNGSGRGGAVMLYAPILTIGEVDITPFADELVRRGVPICVPRLDWPTRTMMPVRIANLSTDLVPDLVNQRLGLRAPKTDAPEVPLDQLAAVIVPGLAFDRRGGRLGRGAGFYDRFIARLDRPAVRVIGVCFEAQLVERAPTEPHDARMDAVVTENGIDEPQP